MTNVTLLTRGRKRLTKQALESLEGTKDCVVTTYDDTEVNKGTASARNYVIELAEQAGRGTYLYLSDNDVYFHRGWLPTLIACYDMAWKKGCRVIGGVNHPFHLHGERIVRYFGVDVMEVEALALQSMLMRWEVWDEFGPFDPTPAGRVCMGEDVMFGDRVRAKGWKLGVVNPAVVVNTGVTNSFGEKIPGYELVLKECPKGVICE